MNAPQASEIPGISAPWVPLHPSIYRAEDQLLHLHCTLHGGVAYSDQIRHAFQSQAGHPFRLESVRRFDLGAGLWL